MTQRLRWCVGKFVYSRGSTHLLHYMRLKGFILDDALDYTHLFLLRGLRSRSPGAAAPDEQLNRWMDTTSVKPVAELAAALLAAQPAATPVRRVAEVYPGVGCTFEYLRYLCDRPRADGRITLSYTGLGPEASRRKYLVLHGQDPETAGYVVEAEGPTWLSHEGALSDLVIYHHNQSVHDAGEPALGVEAFLPHAAAPRLLLAVRVAVGAEDRLRTTVKGCPVTLPAADRVLELCRRARPAWHYCFLPGFDGDFLLPDGPRDAGLMLLYSAPDAPVLPGYKPLPSP